MYYKWTSQVISVWIERMWFLYVHMCDCVGVSWRNLWKDQLNETTEESFHSMLFWLRFADLLVWNWPVPIASLSSAMESINLPESLIVVNAWISLQSSLDKDKNLITMEIFSSDHFVAIFVCICLTEHHMLFGITFSVPTVQSNYVVNFRNF